MNREGRRARSAPGLFGGPRAFFSRVAAAALTAASLFVGAERDARADGRAELARALAEAKRRDLANAVMWRRLVHYRPGLFGGYKSEADGAGFFLSAEGRTDPAAELEATLRWFFAPPSADPGARGEHPLCRFPARLEWLARELRLDAASLPRVACPKLEEYWEKTHVRALTLVFSSYYLNNPSSAFGHTFLRLNKADAHASDERRELLDYGVDYSATVDTRNALLYAIKGITGLFHGNFRRMPYYYKVREYNDFESRDLWEYELDLSAAEVRTVALHLWELGHTYFDYYYLSENCSYHVLAALEVANPSFHLLDHTKAVVMPVDTVKALYAVPDLVRAVRFRPSLRRVFRERAGALDGDERDALARLLDDPEAKLPAGFTPARAAAVLDAALDFVDMHYAGEILYDRERSRGALLKQRLEERRAELAIASEPLVIVPSARERPERSHGSSRVGFGAGVDQASRGFAQLSYRLALHDLADSPVGFPEYAAIEFLPVTMRFLLPEHRASFEDASLVRVASFTPVDRYNQSMSWKVRVGATRVRDSGCPECVFGVAEVGAGAAVGEGLMAFLTTDARVFGPRIHGEGDAKARAGAGPSAGVRARFADSLIALATADATYLPFQKTRATWSAQAWLRWSYAEGFALDLAAQKTPSAGDVVLSTMVYY